MGNIELAAGDTDAAIQKFNKVLVLQPDSAAARYWLAAAYTQKGNLKQVREPLIKALTLQPDNPLAEQLLVRLLILARTDKEAAQLLQALQDKFPKNPQVMAAAGQLALQHGDSQRAVQIFKQGLTLFPDNPLLTYSLAQAYRQMDNQSAFFSTAQDWLKKHPQDIQMQWMLANYYSTLKRYDEAEAAFIKLLEIAPDNTAALNNLAWMLRQKNPQQARQYAEKALTLAPDDGSVMDTLGVIVLEQGDKQRALDLLRKASQQLPQNRDIRYHLAKTLVANGQKDEARQVLRGILGDQITFDSRQEAEALLKELGD
jgi:putative PEP-CTERM system TPR-repeat lipoprotein